MKFRKLRIAWSVVWGVVTVLLCVLWVSSYWRMNGLSGRTFSGDLLRLNFVRGEIHCSFGSPGGPGQYPWTISSGNDFPPLNENPEISAGFGILREPCVTRLYVPTWITTLLIAVAATLPWIHWSKRFTLRTLLIATALVAVVLGLIVWTANR